MNKMQRNALIAVGLAAAAGLVAWLLFFFSSSTDEEGIRVKDGGSIYLETHTSGGFEANWSGFRTRNQTKGCYTVIVTGGTCDGGISTLANANKVRVSSSDDKGHNGDDERAYIFFGKRFKVKDATDWSLSGKTATYGDSTIFLKSIDASTADGKSLRCSSTAKETMWADLKVEDCH